MTIPKLKHKWNCWDRGGHYLWSKGSSFKQLVALVLGLFIVYISVCAVLSQQWQIQATSHDDNSVPAVEAGTRRAPAWMLLAKTRRAVRAAGGVPQTTLSDEDREEWHKRCPCSGRNELLALWRRNMNGASTDSASKKASMKLDDLFEEYSNLHRTCTRGGNMSYVSDLYRQPRGDGAGSSTCKFLVLEFGVYGVGNRVLWLVSAYMYALLTQRVLLIDTRDTIHEILCEPFPGSSWHLPQNFPYSAARRWVMPVEFFEAWDAWEDGTIYDAGRAKKEEREREKGGNGEREYTAEDLERERKEIEMLIRAKIEGKRGEGGDSVDEESASGITRSLLAAQKSNPWKPRGPPPIFNSTQANDGWSPNPRFFCKKDQRRLHQVPWLNLSGGCLYFLPDLFAVPTFRPHLEELFPRRDPLTHLLRQIVYPVDPVWNRVLAVHGAHFQMARRVIGMQVRFRDGGAMFQALNDVVNERMTECAVERALIPNNSVSSTYFSDSPSVVIFIASLHMGLKIHLHEYYAALLELQSETGKQLVKVVQMSHTGFQAFDLSGDFQAFAELIMLSLVDELLTSPLSTFGYVAQAYAGLRPLLVEFNPRKRGNCERGQSSEACYQMAVSKFTCPGDPELDAKLLRDVVPYLQPCQDTEGLQLVPP